MIYLDYQATTPLAPEALEAMLPWLRDQHANPHSAHRAGRVAKAAVEVAREQIAGVLPPGGRVVFTSGATEALNWAIKGTSGPIVTVATEHAAVLDTVAAEGAKGRAVTVLPVGPDGLVDLDIARAAIVPDTGLVAAMLVNNEIGVIQPIAELANLAHEKGALFLCDAVQGYGRVLIPANVDLVALSAHKVHGPKGIGALWVRDGVALEPLLHGGDQEGGRSGTLSPALCAGFGVAARLMQERADEDRAHVERLWSIAATLFVPREGGSPVAARTFGEGAPLHEASRNWTPACAEVDGDRAGLDGNCGGENGEWRLNGAATHRYRGNLSLHFPGLDVARLMSDLRDLAFSAGSACASGSGRPSHVLRAIGLSDAQARASIRLGFGRYTTPTEMTDAVTRIDAAAREQRA
ncbi:cysteine desulfurase family protein [Sphingomonas sp.]|jgi:cysteine desulfurase|uniref:cysteine desulfurase family protein n=1 Tax=Sphingomonas sp. TaxID=28214 RepID=UPI002D7FC16B|nr:cysteine desulfurase family protein [Sphingomonas sp.]HEU0043574.1 cysteine desulfurase family protein [Sphingomonas sp.]